VLAHPEVPRRLDETTLALFYAVEAPAAGATFFSDVRELLPAHPDRGTGALRAACLLEPAGRPGASTRLGPRVRRCLPRTAAGCGALPDALDQAGGRADERRARLDLRRVPGCRGDGPRFAMRAPASVLLGVRRARRLRRTLLHGRGGRALRPRGAPHRGRYAMAVAGRARLAARSGRPTLASTGFSWRISAGDQGDRNRCASHGNFGDHLYSGAERWLSSCCAKAGPWLGSAAYCCVSRGVECAVSGRTRSPPPGITPLQPFRGQRRPGGMPAMQSPGSRPRRWTAFQGPSHATRMALARLDGASG